MSHSPIHPAVTHLVRFTHVLMSHTTSIRSTAQPPEEHHLTRDARPEKKKTTTDEHATLSCSETVPRKDSRPVSSTGTQTASLSLRSHVSIVLQLWAKKPNQNATRRRRGSIRQNSTAVSPATNISLQSPFQTSKKVSVPEMPLRSYKSLSNILAYRWRVRPQNGRRCPAPIRSASRPAMRS